MELNAGGSWIRDLRVRLGLSQVEFAVRIGVSNVTVSRWERGHVHPSPAALRRIRGLQPGAVPSSDGTESPRPPPGNLPLVTTAFFGRERELATAVHHAIRAPLVTLIGPAGCGKTRLAIELGRRLAGRFGDGVWFIDLAPVANPAAVPEARAGARGRDESIGY